MSDRHLLILRGLARHSQRELADHNTTERPQDAASTARQDYLEHAARRTGRQVAAAERRRSPTHARRVTLRGV